ncbi:MAG TPA: diguanylate cyclase [Candidatus Saccharimonadales bacterium]|nr:diguanylate cyclase [Candidatus Saccharimonadales bacterium]
MNGVGAGLAQDLLDSVFNLATELVHGERASLMLRDDASSDFVIAHAVGLADDVRRAVRVREGEGISGGVAASKRSLLVRGAAGPATERDGRYRTASYLSVPILVDNESRGVLNVADRTDGLPFEMNDLETLELLAGHIGACLLQQEQGEAMARLAETDPLTWLFNRRHFDRRLEAESNRALRADHLLALLMIDIDRFKSINNRFGHQTGDQVLRAVATGIKQAVRLYDVPTRYGGDEFAVILPEADTEAASRVARRALEKIAAQALPPEMAAEGHTISVSIGVATFPRPLADAHSLLEAADAAMYRAKEAGGGVRVWEHAFAGGQHQQIRAARTAMPAPYLADPAHLATAELQAHLPAGVAAEWNVLVVGREGHVLTVALPDESTAAVDAISKASGFAIYPVYSSATDLEATRRRLAGI